ncbi:phosphotransferase [Halobaculum halobium]|uniref:Phosphotransferase n=1 Tax=Halobaculum halobium TaxID=3032281 RepID=A0ABD5TEY9_9EURY|nr:phosphotransferase [Halobaculum sp. SYNS20]
MLLDTSAKTIEGVTQLTDFFSYRFAGESLVHREYVSVAPGSYQYLIHPSERSLSWLSNRVDGHSYRRRIASLGINALGSTQPSLLGSVPGVRSVTLEVPRTCQFDIAVVGMRIKVIDYRRERVYTLPLAREHHENIHEEVRTRRNLPPSIDTPRVLDADDTFPYFVEELCDGRTPSNVVEDWDILREGLRQLTPLHRETRSVWVPTEEAIDQAFEALAASELSNDPVVNHTRTFLDQHTLPNELRRSRIHGDFQTGNLIVQDDRVIILDWESSRIDLVLVDLFDPFKRHSIESDDGGPLADLILRTGAFRAISDDLRTGFGPLAWGDNTYYPALPVVYLLLQLAHDPPESTHSRNPVYELLVDVLADVM